MQNVRRLNYYQVRYWYVGDGIMRKISFAYIAHYCERDLKASKKDTLRKNDFFGPDMSGI